MFLMEKMASYWKYWIRGDFPGLNRSGVGKKDRGNQSVNPFLNIESSNTRRKGKPYNHLWNGAMDRDGCPGDPCLLIRLANFICFLLV